MTALVFAAAVLAALAGRSHVLLQMLQQEHYEAARLRVWVGRSPKRLALPEAAGVLLLGVLVSVLDLLVLVPLLGGVAYAYGTWRRETVKPLVFTARAKRLYGVALGLSALVLVVAALLAPVWVVGIVGAVLVVGGTEVLAVANVVLKPVQQADNRRFVRSAEAKLASVKPLVVGISGSFGKTTTKACVAAALEPNGPVLPTPASYNSYLGVVRAINEGLEPHHETFIAELGAYRVGDIAELCALVQPKVGILTSLGPAHLERFGSMDAIEQAEGEVADALPADGLFVTSADDERCRRVARDRARCATLLFSLRGPEGADLWAEDVRVASGGTEFTLRRKDDDGTGVLIKTKLLGAPNVANLLAAAAVAGHLGITDHQLARALRRVRPPKHRLEPIVNEQAGIVVIDDSYNSNPIGAAAALEVLRAHEAGRRILVTPGMVELGEQEAEENRRLGTLAAGVCDLCIISGPLAAHIEQGLREAGFPDDGIVRAADGPAAHKAIAELSRRGDVLLFENDLPDVYV